MELEGTLWGGSNHISRIELKLLKLDLAPQSPWHWNMGFHKDQYLDLFYLPCTPLHLVISSTIIVWISTFMLMIRNCIYHLSHVIQYLDIRHITGWGLHQGHQNMDDQQLVKKTELIIITTSETTSRQEDIVISIGDSPIAPSMEPPMNLVSQLQRCQNNAARIVSLRRKYDHLTPVLIEFPLADSWVQNKLQDPVAGLQGSTWHGSALLVIATVALQTWEVSTIGG